MMKKIEKSGLYNTNTFAHVTLKAIEEIVGRNGLDAILRMAGLDELVDNFPPKNREKVFDFSNYSAINHAIREIYGSRGGRVLAVTSVGTSLGEARAKAYEGIARIDFEGSQNRSDIAAGASSS